MVKKILNLFVLFVLLASLNTAQANMVEGNDGLYYRNGNTYYLVIDNGNRFYTVADLSSAWLDFRSQGNIMVVFNSYTYSFGKDEIVAKNTDILIEEIKTGTVYYEGSVWCHKYETKYPYNYRCKTYAKLKNSALANQK